MADIARLNNSLQENVLTLLAYSDNHGKIIANIVTADLFEGDYRLLAEHALTFWKQHNSAPKDHTPDFLDDILRGNTNQRRRDLFFRIVSAMRQLEKTINTPYVMGQLMNFVRMQRLKSAIIESAEKINAQAETAIGSIETIWSDLLKIQEIGFDPGMRLTEIERLLEYLERRSTEFVSGIAVLDKRGVVPARGTLTALLGVLGEGKTWFLIGVGKNNLRQRKKIVHFSLEMAAEDIVQRYIQSIWAIPTREMEKVITSGLKVDSNGRLKEFTERTIKPEFSFASETIKLELDTRNELLGTLATNLVVKRFPPNRITDKEINSFLDMLEATEGFIADMLLFDAPYLYKRDKRDPRFAISDHIVDTRATCIERNCAGVMVHQINRAGAAEGTRKLIHVAEDWSVGQTCDQAMTLSKTQAEEEMSLARINVGKARNAKDKFEVLITQSYDIGQFCLDSLPMDENVRGKLKELKGNEDDDEQDTDD